MSEKNIDKVYSGIPKYTQEEVDIMTQQGWFDRNRFLTIVIAMVIIWFGLLAFWYLKADEITKDPCTICAEEKGDQVVCSVGTFIPVKRVYYPNGSVYDDTPEVNSQGYEEPQPEFNLSAFRK